MQLAALRSVMRSPPFNTVIRARISGAAFRKRITGPCALPGSCSDQTGRSDREGRTSANWPQTVVSAASSVSLGRPRRSGRKLTSRRVQNRHYARPEEWIRNHKRYVSQFVS
jgi:hypothetical protein